MFRMIVVKCKKKSCGEQFDETQVYEQDSTPPPLPKCPKCGGKTEKVPTFGSYQINGSNTGSTRPNFAKRRK